MGKDSEKDGLRVTKTPVKLEAESHFQHSKHIIIFDIIVIGFDQGKEMRYLVRKHVINQEGQNKKQKTSTVSTTEGLKDSPGKAASLSIQKKPRLQESSSKSGLIVKHNKNSQINHKKKDAQVPTNETPSDTDKMILRTKVILDEEMIR
ncbi:hypothetical protein RDI58_011066 [Solanum bulbocastanum]|uniref:Uncharacterized protein n=1 Tax=Solanum bulbocastanum TaxID=147425 RepID=A0AAN8TRS0_SOLBU